MIVQPDFFDHWKTKALIDITKTPESPIWILRLWAHCQSRQTWRFKLPAIALKAICCVPSSFDADHWKNILTECRFIDCEGDTWTVHQWREHNASLVTSWVNGRKSGGRPKKTHSKPAPNPAETQNGFGVSDREEKRREEKIEKRNNTKPRGGGTLLSDLPESDRHRFIAIGAIMGRRETTAWSAKELAAFEAAGLRRLTDEDFAAQSGTVAAYYAAPLAWLREFWGAPEADFRRRELGTLLNNWGGEVDRAQKYRDFRDKKSAEEARGRLGGEGGQAA